MTDDEEIALDFAAKPPPKCALCGLSRDYHKANTFNCPAKWSRGRAVGYTHYEATVYEPKPVKGATP